MWTAPLYDVFQCCTNITHRDYAGIAVFLQHTIDEVNQGNRRISEYKRCLTDEGTYIVLGGKKGKVLGAIGHMVKSMVAFRFASQTAVSFIAKHDAADLDQLATHLAKGEIVSEIERVYALDEVVAALEHLETGHVKGKLVVVP